MPRLSLDADIAPARTSEARRLAPRETAPIVVATDGSPAAAAAVRVARCIADHSSAPATIVSAIAPVAMPLAAEAPLAYVPTVALDEARRQARLQEISLHVAEAGGSARWPIVVDVGDPPSVITERAASEDAGLIVMGLHRYSTLHRIFRDETTLRVMRRAGIPVLGVAESLTRLPERVVVAVDFSRASLRAARVALSLVADGGVLWLACVQPESGPVPEDLEGRRVIFEQGVHGAFARLGRELSPGNDVRVEPVLLEGAPAPELLSFAARSGAELIAIGSHRRSLLDRMLLGSVTSAVVRDARTSVLVVPPERA